VSKSTSPSYHDLIPPELEFQDVITYLTSHKPLLLFLCFCVHFVLIYNNSYSFPEVLIFTRLGVEVKVQQSRDDEDDNDTVHASHNASEDASKEVHYKQISPYYCNIYECQSAKITTRFLLEIDYLVLSMNYTVNAIKNTKEMIPSTLSKH